MDQKIFNVTNLLENDLLTYILFKPYRLYLFILSIRQQYVIGSFSSELAPENTTRVVYFRYCQVNILRHPIIRVKVRKSD